MSPGTSSGATSVARRRSARRTTRSAQGSPAIGSPGSTSTTAPIRSSTPRRPVRVGLTLTPTSRTCGSARRTAATMWNAADEKSPGTVRSGSSSDSTGPRTPTAPPSRRTGTPAAASIRSVWSRDGCGSRTQVSPSANSPASSRQLLTCALATGRSCTMPRSGRWPGHDDRGRAARHRVDVGAHRREGPGDPGHRPAAQRLVAVEHRPVAALAHQDAGQQADEGAGVQAVDDGRRAQPAKADAVQLDAVTEVPARRDPAGFHRCRAWRPCRRSPAAGRSRRCGRRSRRASGPDG